MFVLNQSRRCCQALNRVGSQCHNAGTVYYPLNAHHISRGLIPGRGDCQTASGGRILGHATIRFNQRSVVVHGAML